MTEIKIAKQCRDCDNFVVDSTANGTVYAYCAEYKHLYMIGKSKEKQCKSYKKDDNKFEVIIRDCIFDSQWGDQC